MFSSWCRGCGRRIDVPIDDDEELCIKCYEGENSELSAKKRESEKSFWSSR